MIHTGLQTCIGTILQAPAQEITFSVVIFISKKNHARENGRFGVSQDVSRRLCDFFYKRNYKQSVPPALTIFSKTTIAGNYSLISLKVRVLLVFYVELIYFWWNVSNLIERYCKRNRRENAAIKGDNTIEFLDRIG